MAQQHIHTAADCCKFDRFEPFARPEEDVLLSALCRLRLPSGARVPGEVVVVRHGDESAVIVLAQGKGNTPPRIAHALPITPDFGVSITQLPPSPSTSFFAQSSKPNIELQLGAVRKVVLQFPPREAARVQGLVKVIRQALDSAGGLSWTHSWLKYYPISDVAEAPPTPDDDDSLERSFGKLDAKDSDDNEDGDTETETETRKNKAADDASPRPSSDFPNPYDPGFDRQDFIRKRLFSRQSKWSTRKPVSIRVVTYNVNDRLPPPGTKELAEVLGYGWEDIIVVGLQEADLRVNSMLVAQDDTRSKAWEAAIIASLADRKDHYEKVAVVQFVGVLMLVMARSEVRTDMYQIQMSSRGIGLLGVGGNKAGVAVRLKVNDTSLCFINCHLAAHLAQLERRRMDYQMLSMGLGFPAPTHTNAVTDEFYPANGQYTVHDSDALFWFGDLNFRLELEDTEIHALIEAQDWSTLVTSDQLLTDIDDNLSFEGFSEPHIRFKPSFKYVHGSTTFDPKRAPAYTDRVLYRTRGTTRVHPRKYQVHELLWSDHLPVTSTFTVDTRVLDVTKRNEEIVAIQVELDKLDELYRPNVELEADELDFGEVSYRRLVERRLKLKNTGLVPATFSFREPAPGKAICKPWFWPFPSTGIVDSGKELTLTVTCAVEEASAGKLTLGEDMNDVLVLQIAGGKDSFISLRATFLPTIAGLPLDMPAVKDKVRNLPLAERKKLLHPVEVTEWDDDAPKGKPPQEYWQLLEYLMDCGTKTERLWTTSVAEETILGWVELLDTAGTLPKEAPYAAAQTLLHLISALPGNLIPESERLACTKVKNRIEAYGVVEKVSGVHANVLIGLMSVVRLCCGDQSPDDETVTALAWSIFGGAPAGREPFVRGLLEL